MFIMLLAAESIANTDKYLISNFSTENSGWHVVSGQRIVIERLKNEWILDQVPSTIPKLVGDKDIVLILYWISILSIISLKIKCVMQILFALHCFILANKKLKFFYPSAHYPREDRPFFGPRKISLVWFKPIVLVSYPLPMPGHQRHLEPMGLLSLCWKISW